MRKNRISPYVDRPILLRAVAAINDRSLASAKAVAEELKIRQEDARELLAGEVTEGFLSSEQSPKDCRYSFVVYRTTARGQGVIGVAA